MAISRDVVTLGSDPELFVFDTRGGYYVPGYYVLGGDIEIQLPRGELVADGLAIEFTVDPAETPDRVVSNIGENLIAIEEFVRQRNDDYVLSCTPWAPVRPEDIATLNPEYGKRCSLQIFGCNPDERVYNLPEIVRPDPRQFYWRSSGGHIHLNFGEALWRDRPAMQCVVMMLDAALGTTLTAASDTVEARERKRLYGKAGYIRVNDARPGLVEYRTLTGQSIIQYPEIASMVFTAAQTIVQYYRDLYAQSEETFYAEIIAALDGVEGSATMARMIDAHDVVSCRAFARRLTDFVPASVGMLITMLLKLKFEPGKYEVDTASFKDYII
jgi:hypothetical protein